MNSRFIDPDQACDSANGGNWSELVLLCNTLDSEGVAMGFIDMRCAQGDGELMAGMQVS